MAETPNSNTSEPIRIESTADLRNALALSPDVNIPSVEQAFVTTRAEIAKLREEAGNLPSPEQVERIRKFIREKSETQVRAQAETKRLKGAVESGSHVPVVAAEGLGAVAGVAALVHSLAESADGSGLGNLGFKDAIKKWISETLSNKPDEEPDDFLERLWYNIKYWTFTSLAEQFGVELPNKASKTEASQGSTDAHTPDAGSTKREKAQEVGADIAFDNGARAIVRFFREKDQYKSVNISDAPMALSLLRGKTYAEIQQTYDATKGNSVELARRLGLPETDPKTVELAVRSLISNEGLVDSIFVGMKSSADWKNRPISEIIKIAGTEFGTLVQIESIQTEEDVKKWIAQVLTPVTPGGGIGEGIRAKYESVQTRFQGLSPSLVMKISSLKSETISEDFIKTLTEGEQSFVRNALIPFRDRLRFMTSMSTVNAGMPEISDILFSEGKGIRTDELLAVFIRTGGNVDFESINAFEHMNLYQSVFALLWSRDERKAASYMTSLMNSPTNLPPQAQKLLSVVAKKSEQEILSMIATSYNVSVGVFDKLTPEQKAGIILSGAILLVAGRALLFTGLVAKVLAGVALISGVIVATAGSSGEKDKK